MKKMNASLAIQILPKVEKELSIKVIDEVIKHIYSKELNTVVSPFETVVEGDFDEIMELLKECFIVAEREGATDILSFIKIAYNPEGVLTIDEKISKYNR